MWLYIGRSVLQGYILGGLVYSRTDIYVAIYILGGLVYSRAIYWED